eukprot:337038-Chlamydomonas_euryale.AAC.4
MTGVAGGPPPPPPGVNPATWVLEVTGAAPAVVTAKGRAKDKALSPNLSFRPAPRSVIPPLALLCHPPCTLAQVCDTGDPEPAAAVLFAGYACKCGGLWPVKGLPARTRAMGPEPKPDFVAVRTEAPTQIFEQACPQRPPFRVTTLTVQGSATVKYLCGVLFSPFVPTFSPTKTHACTYTHTPTNTRTHTHIHPVPHEHLMDLRMIKEERVAPKAYQSCGHFKG